MAAGGETGPGGDNAMAARGVTSSHHAAMADCDMVGSRCGAALDGKAIAAQRDRLAAVGRCRVRWQSGGRHSHGAGARHDEGNGCQCQQYGCN
jgi:hypothetical protein